MVSSIFVHWPWPKPQCRVQMVKQQIYRKTDSEREKEKAKKRERQLGREAIEASALGEEAGMEGGRKREAIDSLPWRERERERERERLRLHLHELSQARQRLTKNLSNSAGRAYFH